ncbi:nucleotidyltransferase domain-containing protein [Sphingomonas sp.]|uniref:nucleotidyltransferase domain-containing protein n=1 Tax=Sphingomonas sp. TaxID=28214 RepID=UPI002DD63E83|nr:nucleotidyltransferase family protein [Sphingomonas sp.]
MKDAAPLVTALRDPSSTAGLDGAGWTALVAMARAEQLAGTLAERVAGIAKPDAAERLLAAARASTDHGRTQALWEAEMARRALAPLGLPVVLLKGTAYVAAGLAAGQGRSIGDLDILVPHDRIAEAEAALLDAGWEWVKPDPYDDEYYRRWMHELPPLIHRERDRMIDVHHTILPLTARITPDAGAMIADSVALENGLRVLSRDDMICHSAAHLFADGDLAGGLRNLWDIHCLCAELSSSDPEFYLRVYERAWEHGLWDAVCRAMRLSNRLFATGAVGYRIPIRVDLSPRLSDRFYLRRLLARDGWGRATRPVTRLGFYVRSHWLRMPPLMLAQHLWTKWRKGAPAPG